MLCRSIGRKYPQTLSPRNPIEESTRFLFGLRVLMKTLSLHNFNARKKRFFDTRYAYADMGFASVLAHELTHWTGHKSRLDRGASLDKNSPSYAFEELVAELGSAFICTELGIESNGLDGHAGYTQGWLSLLEDDNRAIFRASSEAMRAKQFLIPEFKE